jgi:hypothetical protein
MVKRVYVIGDKDDPIYVESELNSIEPMESLAISYEDVEGKEHRATRIEEYDENNNLLRSYEYHEQARTIESIPVYDSHIGLKIMVYINTRDEHGHLNNASSPAHVHIKNHDKKEIGQVNINGPCPTNGSEVVLYRTDNEKEFNRYRTEIARWANIIKQPPKDADKNKTQQQLKTQTQPLKYWDYAKELWKKLDKEGVFK